MQLCAVCCILMLNKTQTWRRKYRLGQYIFIRLTLSVSMSNVEFEICLCYEIDLLIIITVGIKLIIALWSLSYRLCATSFTILSSYSFIGHYMFRPNWPSSDLQVVMVKDSATHCNAAFFPLI
jgi:hypothetical protein